MIGEEGHHGGGLAVEVAGDRGLGLHPGLFEFFFLVGGGFEEDLAESGFTSTFVEAVDERVGVRSLILENLDPLVEGTEQNLGPEAVALDAGGDVGRSCRESVGKGHASLLGATCRSASSSVATGAVGTSAMFFGSSSKSPATPTVSSPLRKISRQ